MRYALRYGGQSFELWVEAAAGAGAGELRARFEAAHEREFGYREPGAPVELVTVTASVWGGAPPLASACRRGGRVSRHAADLPLRR